jgi:CBS domain-containing protein
MLTKEILRIKGNALFTISPSGKLEDAVDVMVEQDIGSLVVMDHGKFAGMLTFREVLKAIAAAHAKSMTMTVADVMAKDSPTVGPDVEMDDLRRLMIEAHCRYVPVLDGPVLVGVLSFHDVAKAVLEEQSFENRMLKGYIKNWPE